MSPAFLSLQNYLPNFPITQISFCLILLFPGPDLPSCFFLLFPPVLSKLQSCPTSPSLSLHWGVFYTLYWNHSHQFPQSIESRGILSSHSICPPCLMLFKTLFLELSSPWYPAPFRSTFCLYPIGLGSLHCSSKSPVPGPTLYLHSLLRHCFSFQSYI